MIVSLKVENFTSIRDEAEFSMKASGSAHLSDHVIEIPDHSGSVVRTAGFYGPNASGKSNVLKVFSALRYLINRTGNLKESSVLRCYEPYALSRSTKNAPIKFEIEFVVSGMRYVYMIQFVKDSILYESLDCFLTKLPSNLFTRDESGWEHIKFGNAFKGTGKKISFFKNNSYLSKILASPNVPDIIKDLGRYFNTGLCYLNVGSSFDMAILNKENVRDIFISTAGGFLSRTDTGISCVRVEENDMSTFKIPEDIPAQLREKILTDNKHSIKFNHISEDGEDVSFSENKESHGTRRLFQLTPALISSFMSQRVFIIDEIDHNIHPHLAALILRLFNDSEVNKHGSQLIFSTHNIELMKPEKMRRDQIWFAEKENGATSIFSLDDFEKEKVKASTPFNKWYDEGRFGGTPNLNYHNIKKFFLALNGSIRDEPEEENEENIFGSLDDLPKFD